MDDWWAAKGAGAQDADSAESVWHVPVRALAGVGSEGAGDDDILGGPEVRLQLGQRVHEAYRQSMMERVADFQAERFVQARYTADQWDVVLSGRIDGLFRDAEGRWVVEEVKSVVVPAGDLVETSLPTSKLEAYRWQCRIYEHLLALELGPSESVTGALVFVDVITGAVTRASVAYEADDCDRFLRRRIRELAEERRARIEQGNRRRAWAQTLQFPYDTRRPFQDRVIEDVAGAALGSLSLALSAPTGIGKTVAALYPMLRVSAATGRRLLFSTAKVSQQQLALDTLDLMVEPGSGITAVQLEAKERSCPEEEILCLPGHCKRLRQHRVRMIEASLPQRILDSGVIRAETIRAEADRWGLCPFELALSLVYAADVVVCDVNYVAHPSAALNHLAGTDLGAARPRSWNLVVDEAHALYSRAIDFLSPRLSASRVRELAEGALHGASAVYRRLVDLLGRVEDLFDDVVAGHEQGPRAGQPKAVVELEIGPWQHIALDIEIWLLDYLSYIRSGGRRPLAFVPRRKTGSRRIVDPVLDFCFDYMAFAEAVEDRAEDRAVVLDLSEGRDSVALTIQCLDPARYLGQVFGRFDSVVAMSATLEPIEFYQEGLGLDRRPSAHSVYPSPFPRTNRLIVADISLSTRFQDRSESLPLLAAKIAKLGSLVAGNHLVFFPSYAYLHAAVTLVQAHLRRAKVPAGVLVVSSATQASEVIELLRQRSLGKQRDALIVCTVLGGSLAEGVDFPGEMAHSAIIVGPGLPMVSFERGLMMAYHDKKTGRGFEYAYLYPGLTNVIQAAGRVIRSEEDQGVMVLLGERFGEDRTLRLLPDYWRDEMVITADAPAEVRCFWEAKGRLPFSASQKPSVP